MSIRMDRLTTALLTALFALAGFDILLIHRLWLTY